MSDETKRALTRETAAAMDLVRDLQTDDATLQHDMIEGETNLFEAIEAALAEVDECDVLGEGLAAHIKRLQERHRRIALRRAFVIGLIDQAMVVADVQTHRFPTATISRKATPPKSIITSEADIPAEFWQPQPPKVDRKALLNALKNGAVPGASLSNGGTTIQIRRT